MVVTEPTMLLPLGSDVEKTPRIGKCFLWTKESALFIVWTKLIRSDLRLFITRPQGNQL